MRIAVFGLGYVGCVTAACLADRGHDLVGVDVSREKVAMIAAGRPTILEDEVDDLVARAVAAGRLRATTDTADAVERTDVALICVGTPSRPNGALSTEFLERVADEIGTALRRDGVRRRYEIVVRSTALPGTCDEIVLPRVELASNGRAGEAFGLAFNPEFLREGSSVADFRNPPRTVIGELDRRSGDVVASLYTDLPGPTFRVPIRMAEMIKYADNSFHALKVAFANEIGAICKSCEIDAQALMDIFLADTRFNVSPMYLRPGFAFGGSCLPKDLRALLHHARRQDLHLPLLEHVLPSNEEHLRRVYDLVVAHGKRRVGLLGLAFKTGTDDLRESPMVELAERLLGRGFELTIYDGYVKTSALAGTNRAYVEARIPHLSRLMVSSPEELVENADVCVVGTTDPVALSSLARANGKVVIDLLSAVGQANRSSGYQGLAW